VDNINRYMVKAKFKVICTYFIKHHTTKTGGGMEVQLLTVIARALHVSGQSASHYSCFNPGETSRYHWVGGWVGSTTSLNAAKKRRNCTSSRKSNPDSSAAEPVHCMPTGLCRNGDQDGLMGEERSGR
jgi:hypothetical protein